MADLRFKNLDIYVFIYFVYLKAADRRFRNLDICLFDKYTEEKAGPVIGVLEQNMYQGKFDWAACPKPTGG